ncbi:MAG TPA: electron transfer flavoprotein subunit beta/FixA family protein [Geminicoccaceae bacterium]|nr:electron transfer flavoprotein subunit beta/FixA family protein [Geminicoccaceae bacterium]
MNVVVCTKFVIDPNQLQADPATGRPDLARAPFRINTFDENAIEAALQLGAANGGRVVGVSLVAAPPPRDVMLKALAMGMQALYLVLDPDRIAADPLRIATVLAAALRTAASAEGIERWDLVLCGEASVDDYHGQVGPRLAQALGLPAVTYAARLRVEGERLLAERALEDRAETVETELPALATVGMEINQPRMPTVLQIMGAGRKPIHELALGALAGLDLAALAERPAVRTLEVAAPPSSRRNIVIEGDDAAAKAAELLRRLGADGEVKL